MEENKIHISDLYKSMDQLMIKFGEFQDALREQKPENWQRDIQIIEAIKSTTLANYESLVGLEN